MIINIIIGMIVAAVLYWAWQDDCFFQFLFLFGMIGGMVSCNESEWYQKQKREEAAERLRQDQADAKPRIVSEADGCKVYTFKTAERWQYFTRCGTSTTTENSYKESCGKGCSRTIERTLTTENKVEK